MAAVFAVRRKSIGGFDKILALKTLLPTMTSQRQAVERFLDEARIASRIDHPCVVQTLDVGEHEGIPWILMELLRGRSVAQLLRASKLANAPVPLGTRLGILARAAEGLAAAHTTRAADGTPLGIVHRDVSPQNIHIGYEGEVKVVDFGIAAARGRLADTTTDEFRGKLSYAAPEQLTRKHEVDHRADVWALGVVAWEVLSGRRLFRGDDERETIFNVLEREIPSLRSLAPGVSEAVSQAVARCLERDPSARMSSAAELAAVLDRAASAEGGDRRQDIAQVMTGLFAGERGAEDERLAAAARGDLPPPPLQPGPSTGGGSLTALSGVPRSRSRPAFAIGALAVVVLAAGAGWFALRSPSPTSASSSSAPAPSPEPAAARARISVKVPEGLRLALVDGTRHDERPLALELGKDQSARVELIAADGRTLERKLSASDDGIALAFPEVATPALSVSAGPTSAKPGKKAPTAGAKPKPVGGPLLSDPY